MRVLAPFVLIAIALGVAILLDDTPPEADLVFVNRSDVFTLDPQRQSYIQDFRMTNALFEGLLRWNNDDFTITPAVAAGMPERSADGLELTFHLRADARWSNRDPVTAHDFVYAWKRLLLPDTAADYSNLIFVIRGAEAFWRWRADQLAAFTADPYADREPVRPEDVLGLVRRLRALAADGGPPLDLAWPADVDRAGLASELVRLERAARSDPESLRLELDTAPIVRRAFEALAAPASRTAEARWMWAETDRRFRATVGITALDDRTLRITLHEPCAYFLDLLCFGVFFPVSRPCVEGWPGTSAEHGVDPGRGWIARAPPDLDDCRWVSLDPGTGHLRQRHEWARPGTLVGNGPYVLAEWRYKRDLRLRRSPTYAGPSPARIETIVSITIEDANTGVLAFESGGIDWLTEVGAEYEADMLAERQAYLDRYAVEIAEMSIKGRTMDEMLAALPPPGPGERRNVHTFPTFGADFYSFNCRPELADGRDNPFHDAAVRLAFVLSVDKRAIVDNVTRLHEPVLDTFIPPGSIPGYEGPRGLGADPDRARRELTEAGWSDRDGDGHLENEQGRRFPIVEILWTTNTPRYKWISLELKAQWEAKLGVQIELRGVDTKFYKEDLKQGNFMIARGRWYGDYGDPTTFLDLCRSTDGNNDRGYESKHVDDLLDRAAVETDPRKRLDILRECERHLFEEEVPMLVLCQLVQVYMYEPGRLKGLSQHPRLTQFLWQMEVEE